MCPAPRVALSTPAGRFVPDRRFQDWLRSARCVSSLYLRCEAEHAICLECKSTKSKFKDRNFSGILEHYIHLGGPFEHRKCESCRISLACSRMVRDCTTCLQTLEDFVSHLIREGDYPWNEPDATIIALSRDTF